MHLKLNQLQQTQDQEQFSGELLLQLNRNPGTLPLLGMTSLGKSLMALAGLKMVGLVTCLRTGMTQLGMTLHGTLQATGLGTTVLR